MRFNKKEAIFALILIVLILAGCLKTETEAEKEKRENYQKCTSVCAATISAADPDEEFTILKICNDECKKRFLNETG